MKAILFWGLAVALAGSASGAVTTDFEESEGFVKDTSPTGVAGWSADTGAVVVAGGSQSGSQHLRVEAEDGGASVTRIVAINEWAQKTVGYYDFWIKPQADPSTEPPTSLSADGALLAFVKDGAHGVVAAFDAKPDGQGTSVLSEATFAIDAANKAQEWQRITLREDYARRKWDIYVNGRLALANLGLDGSATRPTSFILTPSQGLSAELDTWKLSESQPLFTDSDDDGMPDTYELANGLDSGHDDRDADPDGDGVSNIEEFRQGRSPGVPGTGSGNDIYVDNLNGNDANEGLLPYQAGANGPKASLKAAMAAATNGDVIVVLPGTGLYDEGSRGAPDKALTIKCVGKVTIK